MQRERKLSVLSFRSIPISSKVLVVLIASMSDSARLPIFEVREIRKLKRERFRTEVEKFVMCEMTFEKRAKLIVLLDIFDMPGSGAHVSSSGNLNPWRGLEVVAGQVGTL